MTDRLFNELLDTEVERVTLHYHNTPLYQLRSYMRVVHEVTEDVVVGFEAEINPGDTDIVKFLRSQAELYAGIFPAHDPMALFVVIPVLAVGRGNTPLVDRAAGIYGVTNDARYNLGILTVQFDEDHRLWLAPTQLAHWGDKDFTVNIMPYMQFFDAHHQKRAAQAVPQ